jgi:hypothetical protein
MQKLPGKRAAALVLGLTFATAGIAVAQDTTETGRAAIDTTAPAGGALDTAGVDTSAARDTTDTSGVQNPPGYRGMERDTTIFPNEGGPPAEAGQVEDKATGTYEDSAWQDTTGAAQNPAGYRGMERPAAADTGATGTTGDTADTSGTQDTTSTRLGTDTLDSGEAEDNR